MQLGGRSSTSDTRCVMFLLHFGGSGWSWTDASITSMLNAVSLSGKSVVVVVVSIYCVAKAVTLLL
jgi:hypothetical protein